MKIKLNCSLWGNSQSSKNKKIKKSYKAGKLPLLDSSDEDINPSIIRF